MKKTNKGFSLVELIIVIAIMAILAAAIAPALIRYIDKSRRADDVTAAGTVLTAVQTSLANEDCYKEIVALRGNLTAGQTKVLISVDSKGAVTPNGTAPSLVEEVSSSVASGCPIKYTKDGANYYTVAIDANDTLYVFIAKNANGTDWQIQPNTAKLYK